MPMCALTICGDGGGGGGVTALCAGFGHQPYEGRTLVQLAYKFPRVIIS